MSHTLHINHCCLLEKIKEGSASPDITRLVAARDYTKHLRSHQGYNLQAPACELLALEHSNSSGFNAVWCMAACTSNRQ
jgi:hypothetical protein